jgi:ABC-type Na+ efflux pump permease subunit
VTVIRANERWTNPITSLAVGRRLRARGFTAWVLVGVCLAGGAAMAAYQWPEGGMALLQRALPGRLPSTPRWRPSPLQGSEIYLLFLALAAFVVLTVGGTVPQAALAISREREKRTLEPLVLTPMSPAAILWGKLVEVLLTPALATLALLPLFCLSFSLGSVSLGSIAAAAGVLLLCHLFFGTASLAISCWRRRGGLAVVLAYGWVLLVCAGPSLIASWHGSGAPGPWWVDALFTLSPAAALLDCVVPGNGVLVGSIDVPSAVVGSALYALLIPLLFALGVAGLRRSP